MAAGSLNLSISSIPATLDRKGLKEEYLNRVHITADFLYRVWGLGQRRLPP